MNLRKDLLGVVRHFSPSCGVYSKAHLGATNQDSQSCERPPGRSLLGSSSTPAYWESQSPQGIENLLLRFFWGEWKGGEPIIRSCGVWGGSITGGKFPEWPGGRGCSNRQDITTHPAQLEARLFSLNCLDSSSNLFFNTCI